MTREKVVGGMGGAETGKRYSNVDPGGQGLPGRCVRWEM